MPAFDARAPPAFACSVRLAFGVRESLTRHQGDIRQVTAELQIPRKTLYDKMARHGLIPARHRRR